MVRYDAPRAAGSAEPIVAEQLLKLWQMQLQHWNSWWSIFLGVTERHSMTRAELQDMRHAQLVVPEPLRECDEPELFA